MSHHFLRFTDVSYTYPSGFKALDNVSFEIRHGEKVALLGLNGAGKSTLLRHTNGLLISDNTPKGRARGNGGEVNVGGVIVSRKTLPTIRRTVGMVFQNPDDQLFMPTVREDVAFGPANIGLSPDEIDARVADALEQVGALHLIDRSPWQLSGGQKRAVAIATVLSMLPDILVLDEPGSNLDMRACESLARTIESFGHTCLIATHDLDFARRVCSRALLLHQGRIIADTGVDEAIGMLRQVSFG